METVRIIQNRSNRWTVAGLLMAGVLVVASAAGMVVAWPVEWSFEWLLLPLLFIGALAAGGNYAYWLASPRDAVFEVAADMIRIEDQPVLRWTVRTFVPEEVVEVVQHAESGSCIRTRDGGRHPLSDILMMRSDEIFEVLAKHHPHIALTRSR